MPKKLEGKVAVITGGSSGIGLSTTELFVQEGAHVFITGRRQKELDEAVKKFGKNVTAVQGDVSNLKDLDKLYTTVKKQKGHVDILFANAGIYEFSKLGSITEEQYEKMFSINVKGLIFTVQKALPILKPGASIILNASIASSTGPSDLSVYCATKAAVRSFARTWATDLKGKIRVNALSPGVVPTPGFSNSFGLTDEQIKEFTDNAIKKVPMGRVGYPEEIAKAALFLASDDSSYVTGIELFVDGGFAQV